MKILFFRTIQARRAQRPMLSWMCRGSKRYWPHGPHNLISGLNRTLSPNIAARLKSSLLREPGCR